MQAEGPSKRNGIVIMIWASLCFAIMAALVKGASTRLPAVQLVWMRSVLALPMVWTLLMRSRQQRIPNHRLGVLLRSVFGTLAMSLSFYSLAMLPLSDQMLLSKTGPLWIALFAPLFLNERANAVTWICVLTALAGSAVVLRPSYQMGNIGGIAALSGAFFSAVAHMWLRRLRSSDASITIVFWFNVLTAVLTTPVVFWAGQWPSVREWLFMTAVAVAATAGQLLMTQAYATEEAPRVSAASYVNILFGLLIAYIVWGEVPSVSSGSGGILIIAAGWLLVRSSRRPRAENASSARVDPPSGGPNLNPKPNKKGGPTTCIEIPTTRSA